MKNDCQSLCIDNINKKRIKNITQMNTLPYQKKTQMNTKTIQIKSNGYQGLCPNPRKLRSTHI